MISEELVRVMLKMACNEAGSQYQWATKYKISPAYVSDVIRGNRSIGKSILKALRLRKIVAYQEVKS